MGRGGGDRFDRGLTPAAGGLGGRPRGDRVDVGRPWKGSVYPSKGKGYGVQGEAAYPDLLDHWDRLASWQSWRKGMALARSQLIGAAERWAAVEVWHRDSYAQTPQWRTSALLLAGFTSDQSPEGRWTVAVQPRGTEISAQPVGSAQREVWYQPPATEGQPAPPRMRLLELNTRTTALGTPRTAVLHLNRMLIGEVIEDSAISATALADDLSDGLGLLCVAVHEASGLVYFDASRCWRRQPTGDGRMQLREIPIAPGDPLPTFRADRHLTQALTLSCNCPAHLGLEFTVLRDDQQLGGQNLFPQRSPSGLDGPRRGAGQGSPEGVRRRFQQLPWQRIPGQECKHCHAVRWALGVPMAEPTDMPSPDSDYWRDLAVMARLEEANGAMDSPRFLEQLRSSLLDEQAFSMLDVTLLAAVVGDCVGIAPQRIPFQPIQLGGAATPFAALGVLRQNEQHPTVDPREDEDAVFGDWWVGRGSAVNAYGFDGPGKVSNHGPVMRPLAMPDRLPRTLP